MDIHDEVWESLGFYVYAYIDPIDSTIRYIGKGTGDRALSHLHSNEESDKVKWIQGLKEIGKIPQIDIIARNLSEETALLIERSLIDSIGLGHGKLTNKVRGHDVENGRESIQEIAIKLNPNPAEFKHKLSEILIEKIEPISKEIKRLLDDKKYLDTILLEGSDKADKIASKKIKEMKELVGF